MPETQFLQNLPKFKTPEEEIAYLREHISKKEQAFYKENQDVSKEEIVKSTIDAYKVVPVEKIIPENQIVSKEEVDNIVLSLSPESHDSKIEEFFGIMVNKGLKNTFSVLKKMNNPHLDDDFHRFLVQYLITGRKPSDYKENIIEASGLSMRLFEVSLPNFEGKENISPGNLIAKMEQFISGMQAIADGRTVEGKDYFTLELAVESSGSHLSFYVAIPASRADLFEKNILAVFPDARIKEKPDDYNIFNNEGYSNMSYAKLSELPVFPLKSFDNPESDPMASIISAFSKFNLQGEGASIQFILKPVGDAFIKRYNRILDEVRKGKDLKDIYKHLDSWGGAFKNIAKDFFSSNEEKKEKVENKKEEIIKQNVEKILKKVSSTILSANIRIVTSASSPDRSEQMMREVYSVFNQFSDPLSNSIFFEKVKENALFDELHYFSYRVFKEDNKIPLSQKEIATMIHMPQSIESSPHLSQTQMKTAPAPFNLKRDGILIGVNYYRGQETEILFSPEDRMRHLYVIGQTGTGKTTILKNMIAQDILAGHGCCFIDPHGTDIQHILSYIPKERIDDVIYFDPASLERPMGLNMLEFDPRFPEQKTFVINELMSIFNKLFDMKTSGGPMFEQYFRNSAGLVMEHPESGNTLLEIGRVLSDKSFRDMKLKHCKNPLIIQFWKNAEATTGEQGLANFVPYITSKFDGFLSNEIMRPIVTQEKSSFNFRQIMDEKKILLVNLAKGRLGELNANLIGMILVGKIQMAALSRVDMFGKKMNDFYLYIDEFQNVTTDSIASILSEARKYRLSLNIAHQFIAQLIEPIRDAVFGNVGSMAVYRVSPEDAEFLAKKFEPTFSASDIIKLDNFYSYVSTLVDGIPVKPFSMKSHWSLAPKGNPEIVEKLKELSALKFGRPREILEAEFIEKLNHI